MSASIQTTDPSIANVHCDVIIPTSQSAVWSQSLFPSDHRQLVSDASQSVQYGVQRLPAQLHRHRGNRLAACWRILHLKTHHTRLQPQYRINNQRSQKATGDPQEVHCKLTDWFRDPLHSVTLKEQFTWCWWKSQDSQQSSWRRVLNVRTVWESELCSCLWRDLLKKCPAVTTSHRLRL